MRIHEVILENFADGKKPGRKGLAKRSGVNTKASVSSLRKTAKHSTGEKARMAHWLANMKAGRAKHESEGDPEGLPHITKELLTHIVQQVGTEGAHAIIKSLEWGDGAAKEFLHLIVRDLEQDIANNDIEEGWKDIAAAGALATGLAFGHAGDAEAKNKHQEKPVAVQQVKQQTPHQAKAPVAAPVKKVSPAEAESTLKNVAMKSGLKGTELAQFMAQCQHETLNFTKMKEIGGSLDFKKYDPKHAPKKAKALGNTKAGDGSRYAGRGFIQLTGRDNYKRAGEALGLPLEQHPEMVENPMTAAKVAVWFWKNRVQAKVDYFNDTTAVTKVINPGLRGLDSRQSAFKDYKIQLAQR